MSCWDTAEPCHVTQKVTCGPAPWDRVREEPLGLTVALEVSWRSEVGRLARQDVTSLRRADAGRASGMESSSAPKSKPLALAGA